MKRLLLAPAVAVAHTVGADAPVLASTVVVGSRQAVQQTAGNEWG